MVETAAPKRGEIWICDLGQEAGVRPAAVISTDFINEVREKVVVALGTTKIRSIPTEIPIGKTEGLAREGVLNAGDILTVPKQWLHRKTGKLNQEKIELLQQALCLVLDIKS